MMNKLFPELIKNGYVYVGMSPLYTAKLKDSSNVYFWDDKSKDEWFKKNRSKVQFLTRSKGLAELSHQTLREVSLDPKTRHIIKVTEQHVDLCEKAIEKWMNKETIDERKSWINKNIDFTKADD